MSNARKLAIDGLYSPPEAAQAVGRHVTTIYQAIDNGKLAARLICPLVSAHGMRERTALNSEPLVLYFIEADDLRRWRANTRGYHSRAAVA